MSCKELVLLLSYVEALRVCIGNQGPTREGYLRDAKARKVEVQDKDTEEHVEPRLERGVWFQGAWC